MNGLVCCGRAGSSGSDGGGKLWSRAGVRVVSGGQRATKSVGELAAVFYEQRASRAVVGSRWTRWWKVVR